MNPKISHIQIQTAEAGGRWFAKEVPSADKSEKTLVFFQRSGPRSLKDFISDKLQGVRSGRSIAEKHMLAMGLQGNVSINSAVSSGKSGGTRRLTDEALNQHLNATIQQVKQQRQGPIGNAGTSPSDTPGVSLRHGMDSKLRADRDRFCARLWHCYTGSMPKADFMQLAKDAFAMARGKMGFTDAALTQKVTNFLQTMSTQTTRDRELDGDFNAVRNAIARKKDAAGNASSAEASIATVSLENSLLQGLESGDKEGFCDAITQEFVRVRADKAGWNPELETLAFRARMALAFDIAKDEQRVQAGVEAVGSDSLQAKQILYLAADRGVTSDPHSVNEAMRALESLPQLGIDPEIVGLLHDMRELVRQSRDQDAY